MSDEVNLTADIIEGSEVYTRFFDLENDKDTVDEDFTDTYDKWEEARSKPHIFDEEEVTRLQGIAEHYEGLKNAWYEDYGSEWRELEAFVKSLPDSYRHITFIATDHFTDYIQQDLKDQGVDIPSYIVVDWEETANALQTDYSIAETPDGDYYYKD